MISVSIIPLLFYIVGSQVPNDDPCSAIEITGSAPLLYQGATTVGATISAFELSLPFCGTLLTSPSVWYKINNIENLFILTPDAGRDYDTKLSLWTADDCNDVSTFTCIDGNDDCLDPVIPGFGSCVSGGEAECYEEIYIQLHGFGGSAGTTDLNITGLSSQFGCGQCGHTWNTGPNKAVQCISDDICCPGLSCNQVNGKCNLPASICTDHVCGHIQNSGPNKPLNCNDDGTNCCDGFICNTNNGKCLKKKGEQTPATVSIISGGSAVSVSVSTLCANNGARCDSSNNGCCSGSCNNDICEGPIGGTGAASTPCANNGARCDSSNNGCCSGSCNNDICEGPIESIQTASIQHAAILESNINDENSMNFDDEPGSNDIDYKLLIMNMWAMMSIFLFIVLFLFYFHKRCDRKQVFESHETKEIHV